MSIQVIDFFSGCGGTSAGFRAAGLEILGGLDIDPEAAATFRENFPCATFIEGDVRALAPDVLKPVIGAREKPLLFAGCAPCQPFSRQNKTTTRTDPRRTLLKEFGRFVEAWLPEYVFIENVPGMQRFRRSGPLHAFQTLLRKLGYQFECSVVPALWYGVPQTRERLVLVASRQATVQIPAATHGPGMPEGSYTTVGDWIRNLPVIGAGQTHAKDPDHAAAVLSETNLRRIRATPEGGGRESWPKSLWLECHKTYSGHSDVYGRLAWDKQAAGLTTRCISYSNGRFGHPSQDRALSVREAACLQTFPRDYRFIGSLSSKARQIGNAVPPKMAEAFGREFLKINEPTSAGI
ncbi:DNA cytosine methyltransferase [Paraburkholderia sp. SIMBA_053]|uniref:DNA cytosine methyltransferase n=1 Tax=Paraburkholderia sp. SIMBA_053 TaxID=3085794 RepID=UPI00397E41C0